VIFKSLEHNPIRTPNQAVVDLMGGADEVLHLRAFGKELGIRILLDENNAAVVIETASGLHRQPLVDSTGRPFVPTDVEVHDG